MKKTIALGYVKFPGEDRRRKAFVEIELKNTDGKYKLSMCGEIKRCSWGQCREEIKKYMVAPRKNFNQIMDIWETYHLNDMHTGTPKQEEEIKKAHIPFNQYDKICERLKEKGIYEDNGYKYGTGWLYEPIPEWALNEIFNW